VDAECLFMFVCSQAYKEGKKERPPFQQEPEPVVEKPEIPEDLLCNVCKDLLTDAVMIPCCGNSFCDECKLLRCGVVKGRESCNKRRRCMFLIYDFWGVILPCRLIGFQFSEGR
jgi:hypothetical protein